MWGLTVGEPFKHDGETAWVAPARGPGGEDLVLKLGTRHYESDHEADGLRVWDGDEVARLHASMEFDDLAALLLERCRPGAELGRTLPEAEQDEIVAGLLRRLWRPAGSPFRPLSSMCDAWADGFERRYRPDVGDLDPGLAREGIALFRSLPRGASESVLLCTDLHGGNILSAEREPWLVIDPKPYVGDPAYDTVQHMLNCEERLHADPVGLAKRMASLVDLDGERVRLWLFARCVCRSPLGGLGLPRSRGCWRPDPDVWLLTSRSPAVLFGQWGFRASSRSCSVRCLGLGCCLGLPPGLPSVLARGLSSSARSR
jgi:streptomycin 6-kinase